MKPELLAPAGNIEKLKTAFHYGADAVYCGGKNFSLRAMTDNFTESGLIEAVKYAHSLNKKIYITANIFAFDGDFADFPGYFKFLEQINADAVIISDLGVVECCRKYAPELPVHISTQANVTNKYTAKIMADMGASRIVLARELSLKQIADIREYLPDNVEIEAFVHGAMCIAYSGRCLISNVLSERASNRGECVQACRWNYEITETSRPNEKLGAEEDERGTYILNSKDLNMIEHIQDLADAGVCSLKIEGRMKTSYYVATVVNAYRRALDNENYYAPDELRAELYKTGHRSYTTGFYYPSGFKGQGTVSTADSKTTQGYDYAANVLGYDEEKKAVIIEQRNRFKKGDALEVLSPGQYFNRIIYADKIYNGKMYEIDDAKNVQEILYLPTDIRLNKYDILRIKK